jgi:hypothetical protein
MIPKLRYCGRVLQRIGSRHFSRIAPSPPPIVARLRTLDFGNVHEVNFGGPSPDCHDTNWRAYMWRQMKNRLVKSAIPDEEQLALQICLPGYHINRSNKLVLESKSDLAQRGEASPDDADALALTFAQPVVPIEVPPQHSRNARSSPVSAYRRRLDEIALGAGAMSEVSEWCLSLPRIFPGIENHQGVSSAQTYSGVYFQEPRGM